MEQPRNGGGLMKVGMMVVEGIIMQGMRLLLLMFLVSEQLLVVSVMSSCTVLLWLGLTSLRK